MRERGDRAVRVHRWLLVLYPSAFRARFGAELEATFAAAWRRARSRGGVAAARFLVAALIDLVVSAWGERREHHGGRRRRGGAAQDLRHAVRGLRRRPGFAAAVIATVALGIGANAAVFSLVDAVLLRPVPVGDPRSVVAVFEALESNHWGSTSWPTYTELRDDLRTLSGLGVSSELDVGLRVGDVSDRVLAGVVSGNWFGVLGLVPQAGRLLQPDDEAGGGRFNVVLSHDLWRRHFAADPAVVGRAIELSGRTFTVVGVAPEGFRGTDLSAPHDLWIPIVVIRSVGGDGLWGADVLTTRFLPFLRMVGRLRPGVAPEAAAAELNARHAALREVNGAEMDMPFADPPIHTLPIGRAATAERRGDIVRFLAVPAAVALLTLAIACMNVALLLLVRASERRQEFGIRTALGAGRGRLARQVMTESLLIGVAGCAIGIGVAQATVAVLRRFPLPGNVAMDTLQLAPDARMLGFGLLVALATALVFGSVPAWAATRSDVVGQLRRSIGSPRGDGGLARLVLLSGQIALCLALLVGAGLFLRSLRAALEIDPGFDADGVAAASFSLLPHGYTRESGPPFFRTVVEQVGRTPGIEAAALGVHVPIERQRLRMPLSNEVVPQGPGSFAGTRFPLAVNVVAGDWFDVLRIPVLSGRVFDASDGPGAPPVAVLSASAAAELWPGEDPLGRQLQLVRGIGPGITVIGVVGDIVAHAVQEGPVPYVYVSALQSPQIQALSGATLLARDNAAGTAALAAIRRVLAVQDPTLPVFRERRVADQIAGVLVPQRLGSTLLTLFGAVALLVAAVGIYGVVAFAVARRRFEIGLRRALGARPRDIIRDVTRHTALAVLLGTLAGTAAALWLTRFIDAFLFGIPAVDPIAYAAAATLISLTALAATLLPARRATRVSPLTAIRGED